MTKGPPDDDATCFFGWRSNNARLSLFFAAAVACDWIMTASSLGKEESGGPPVDVEEHKLNDDRQFTTTADSNKKESTTETQSGEGGSELSNTASKHHDERCSQSSPTELVYLTYEGNFEHECEARVTAVVDDGSSSTSAAAPPDATTAAESSLVLDRTVLHAQGGGQPTDWGWIIREGAGPRLECEVRDVRLDRATGMVTHRGALLAPTTEAAEASASSSLLLSQPLTASSCGFRPGDKVRVRVQADRRRLLSECHTAGHVVDAALARCQLWLKPSKGYHFLDGPYVEYHGTIPTSQRSNLLEQLQTAFQQLVDEDIPTNIQLLNRDDAERLCNKEAPTVLFDANAFTGDPTTGCVRVVTVAGYPCPCGGTHVKSSGDLRDHGWAIIGLKCKSQVVRVKYGRTKEGSK